MPSVDINWLAIIAAVAINMVIGAIWYSPVMFAKDWAKLTGRKMNELLGKLHFWGSLVSINLVFFPMFIQGLMGVNGRARVQAHRANHMTPMPASIPATSMTAIVTGREAVSGTSPDRITALAPSAPI